MMHTVCTKTNNTKARKPTTTKTKKLCVFFRYQKHWRLSLRLGWKIRENATTVETKGKNIIEYADEASNFLRESLDEVRKAIQDLTSESEAAPPP
jgi:hypothetical protein